MDSNWVLQGNSIVDHEGNVGIDQELQGKKIYEHFRLTAKTSDDLERSTDR